MPYRFRRGLGRAAMVVSCSFLLQIPATGSVSADPLPDDFLEKMECLLIPQLCETCPPNCLLEEGRALTSGFALSPRAELPEEIRRGLRRVGTAGAELGRVNWARAMVLDVHRESTTAVVPLEKSGDGGVRFLLGIQNARARSDVCYMVLGAPASGRTATLRTLDGAVVARMSARDGQKLSIRKPRLATAALPGRLAASCVPGAMADDDPGIGSCIWDYDVGGTLPTIACGSLLPFCAILVAGDCVGDHW